MTELTPEQESLEESTLEEPTREPPDAEQFEQALRKLRERSGEEWEFPEE